MHRRQPYGYLRISGERISGVDAIVDQHDWDRHYWDWHNWNWHDWDRHDGNWDNRYRDHRNRHDWDWHNWDRHDWNWDNRNRDHRNGNHRNRHDVYEHRCPACEYPGSGHLRRRWPYYSADGRIRFSAGEFPVYGHIYGESELLRHDDALAGDEHHHHGNHHNDDQQHDVEHA
jgi:hypothetical protein